ncbi:MAG: hypothetical protein ABI833_20255 [Acidobacteriota bacterium]
MKARAMITMAAIFGSSVWAAKSDGPKVTICIKASGHEAEVVSAAATSASKLLRSAGVTLEWHTNSRTCLGQGDQVMIVSLSTDTPKTFHPGALAYALPYEGVHIQVFYDRIAQSTPELLPHLLALVVVHEVTHILQGIDRHSSSGIMKAQWSTYDFTLMKRDQLRFTDSDVDLIHNGLAKRADRGVKGAIAAANAR